MSQVTEADCHTGGAGTETQGLCGVKGIISSKSYEQGSKEGCPDNRGAMMGSYKVRHGRLKTN